MIKINELIKNPKIKIFLTVIIIVIISLAFFRAAYVLGVENNNLKNKIKKDHEEIAHSGKIASALDSLNSEITKINSEITLIEESLFTNPEEIFSRLNRFTQEVKISLRSISPGERNRIEIPNQKDMYIELLPVTIELNCDFSQLLAFLKKIEGFKKIIAVDDIKIQSDPQDAWNHNIDIELKAPLLIYAKANE